MQHLHPRLCFSLNAKVSDAKRSGVVGMPVLLANSGLTVVDHGTSIDAGSLGVRK